MLPTVLLILVLAGSLLLIPLGLPGLWLMVAAVLVGVLLGEVGWGVLLVSLLAAATAELLEFLLVRRLALRYGGSTLAFWGAIGGGLVGMLIGVPIPVVGPVLAGLAGTFIGAALVTVWQTGEAARAGRVGWGAVLGRAASAAAKTGAGIIILVLGTAALLVG